MTEFVVNVQDTVEFTVMAETADKAQMQVYDDHSEDQFDYSIFKQISSVTPQHKEIDCE